MLGSGDQYSPISHDRDKIAVQTGMTVARRKGRVAGPATFPMQLGMVRFPHHLVYRIVNPGGTCSRRKSEKKQRDGDSRTQNKPH